MSDAITGGLVTGVFTLGGVWLTLRHQARQADKAEQARIMARRAERLRESYRLFVQAAYTMQGHASMLPIALIESQRGRPSFFNKLMDQQQQADVGEQRASLLLEQDADRAILAEFSTLNTEHTIFLAAVASYLDKEDSMPDDEYERRITSMKGKADNVARLASDRLGQLEKPLLTEEPWWRRLLSKERPTA